MTVDVHVSENEPAGEAPPVEVIEPVAEAAVEIAEIQADRDVRLAEIAADTHSEAIEADLQRSREFVENLNSDLELELSQCRTTIASLELLNTEQAAKIAALEAAPPSSTLSNTGEPIPSSPSGEPEPAAPTPASLEPEAAPEVVEERKPRRRPHRWI